jgi:hypothetical protein
MSSEAKEVVKIYLNLRLLQQSQHRNISERARGQGGKFYTQESLMRALPEPERGT